MKKLTFLLLLCLCATTVKAQDFFVKANFVSAYLWRGLKVGGPCLQPSLGVSWKGFTLVGWASTEFDRKSNEIDLSLSYDYKGLNITLLDVFCQDGEDKFNFFNYKNKTTNHTIEVDASYVIHPKFPMKILWATRVAGKDWDITTDPETQEIISKKRRWSTYCELSYPFNVKGIGVKFEAGFAPWNSVYTDKFNVVNVSMEVSKAIQITEKWALPISAKIMFNPDDKQTHFQVKLSI